MWKGGDGIPHLLLYFFLHSLVPDRNRIITNLFLACALIVLPAGEVCARWRIRGQVLEAGSREPVYQAVVTCAGYPLLGCTGDFDGQFTTTWFGDTVCGARMQVDAYGYKQAYFYIPWLPDNPSVDKSYTITIYLEPDYRVIGQAFNGWNDVYRKRFRRRDSTDVSLRVWVAVDPSQLKVSLRDSAQQWWQLCTAGTDSVFRARVPSRMLHTLSWHINSSSPSEICDIRLRDIAFHNHHDLVLEPDIPVKPADWKSYPYPKPMPHTWEDGIIAVEPEPLPIIFVEQRPFWPGGEEAFMDTLLHHCRDIPFSHAQNMVLHVRVDRLGMMRLLPPEHPVQDTVALQAITKVLETGMPAWAPGKFMGRPVNDHFYLMLDTKAISDRGKGISKNP